MVFGRAWEIIFGCRGRSNDDPQSSKNRLWGDFPRPAWLFALCSPLSTFKMADRNLIPFFSCQTQGIAGGKRQRVFGCCLGAALCQRCEAGGPLPTAPGGMRAPYAASIIGKSPHRWLRGITLKPRQARRPKRQPPCSPDRVGYRPPRISDVCMRHFPPTRQKHRHHIPPSRTWFLDGEGVVPRTQPRRSTWQLCPT